MKSKREGPALRRSVNVVSRRRCGVEGPVGSEGSETAVARLRAGEIGERECGMGEGFRQLTLGILGRIMSDSGEIAPDKVLVGINDEYFEDLSVRFWRARRADVG